MSFGPRSRWSGRLIRRTAAHPKAATTSRPMSDSASSPGTNRGSTRARDRGTVRRMKPFVVFALWAIVGWNVGAWAEAAAGIPTAVGTLVGVAIGAALAVEVRRRAAASERERRATVPGVPVEAPGALDRAA